MSRPSAFFLPAAVLACAMGVGAVVFTIAWVAKENSHPQPAQIHFPSLVQRMGEPGMVGNGASVFAAQCMGCHGAKLEGGEGPCLTDQTWLKGGTPTDILKSINTGDIKGMPAFETILKEDEKIALIAFITSRAQGLRDVKYKLYEGKWQKLPDFASLTPKDTGTLALDEPMTLAKFKRHSNYGLLYTAQLQVPVAGEYTFNLGSDDGAQLLLDGQMVVDYDGLHGDTPKPGTVTLTPGLHDFELRYFQATQKQGLSLTWSGPVSAGFLTEPVAEKEQILILHQVRVVRGILQGQRDAYILMLGFPGGRNCAVDLQRATLPAAWRGDFLNVGGTRLGRGISPNIALGSKMVVLAKQPLVRLKDKPQEVPEYLGYELSKTQVTLHWRLGGARFDQVLSASGTGLKVVLTFVDPAPGPVLLLEQDGKTRTLDAAQAKMAVVQFPF